MSEASAVLLFRTKSNIIIATVSAAKVGVVPCNACEIFFFFKWLKPGALLTDTGARFTFFQ